MSQKKAKQLRREMKANGQVPTKTIFMSRDTKAKFDLRQRVFSEWQLIANICDSALQSKSTEEGLKKRLESTKELAGTILVGVSTDLDYWLDTEMEKQGVGKSAGYLMINLDPDRGSITVVKAPPPPEPDAEKLSAVLKQDLKCQVCKADATFVHQDRGAFCEEHIPGDLMRQEQAKGETDEQKQPETKAQPSSN